MRSSRDPGIRGGVGKARLDWELPDSQTDLPGCSRDAEGVGPGDALGKRLGLLQAIREGPWYPIYMASAEVVTNESDP